MSKNKHFKKLVRERMARTGEKYTTARAALLAQKPQEKPQEKLNEKGR